MFAKISKGHIIANYPKIRKFWLLRLSDPREIDSLRYQTRVSQSLCTVKKKIHIPRYNIKCSGENVILCEIFHVVSSFPLHFMLFRGYLPYFDYFSGQCGVSDPRERLTRWGIGTKEIGERDSAGNPTLGRLTHQGRICLTLRSHVLLLPGMRYPAESDFPT